MKPQIKRLSGPEIDELLALDVPAHLATIDPDGYPRITPIWFLWDDGAFVMTSIEGYPHLRNLARDPRAAVCVDTEEHDAIDGHRPNRRVRARGDAQLFRDDGEWTRRITRKYVTGPEGERTAERRASMSRVVIRIRPVKMLAQR